MNFQLELQKDLRERKEQSLYRQRATVDNVDGVFVQRAGKRLVSFCSNDYLGLADHPKIVEAFTHAATKYGVGAKASHLVNGHSREHHLLEEELAAFTGRPRALLFSTGYMANVGTITALAGRQDVVFQDKLNHASLLDGALLSPAAFVRYKHNDLNQLAELLTKHQAKRRLIVVDGVFSMDGDFADLPGLVSLAELHGAWLMVDDAHGFGCVGENGGGSIEYFGLSQNQVPILVGTLGKAFGTFGAFVSGSDALIETLIQFARPYIYTTAIPPAVAAATRASLRVMHSEPERRLHLLNLIKLFRHQCDAKGLRLMDSTTAIQPIIIGDVDKTLDISLKLEERGYWVSAIRPPTVPVGTARLRITLSAQHTVEQVEKFVDTLVEVCDCAA